MPDIRFFQQLGVPAILMQQDTNGHLVPVALTQEFSRLMECSMEEALQLMRPEHLLETIYPTDRPWFEKKLEHILQAHTAAQETQS